MVEEAAQGSVQQQEKLTNYLHGVLDNDATLRTDVKKLAAEIHQEIQIDQGDGSEVWNVMGGKAEKNVYQDNKGTVLKDLNNSPVSFTTNNYYGKPPED